MFTFFIIFACGLIQGIFGIGLLAMGIPILLVFGTTYPDALISTLPSSLIISVYQTFQQKSNHLNRDFILKLFVWAMPFLILSLYTVVLIKHSEKIVMLLAGSFILLLQLLKIIMRKHQIRGKTINDIPNIYITLVSVIHGFTGQGGPALLFLSTLYGDRKDKIQFFVAYFYVLFSCVGLIIVFTFDSLVSYNNIILQIICALSGAVLGTILYRRIPDVQSFTFMINILLNVVAVLLIIRSIL